MKNLIYYAHDKRCKDNMRPVYMDAPWYLWAVEIVSGFLFGFFAHINLKVHAIIEKLNENGL